MEYQRFVSALNSLPKPTARTPTAERAYRALLYDYPDVSADDASELLSAVRSSGNKWPEQFPLSNSFISGLLQALESTRPPPGLIPLPAMILAALTSSVKYKFHVSHI